MDTYFNGLWRMDWGFGNANKTAAFIVLLMIGLWGLTYWRRWVFWPILIANTALGVCLMHTFSRGGIIAAIVGFTALVWAAPRPWAKIRLWAVIIAVWCVLGSMIYLQAHKRLGQGLVQEDKSITNRLALWKAAPQMIWDAPSGWGLGNSGRAYMNWYQPLERGEIYRTLVNSHLTWLVEFNWLLRVAYLFGWATIFLLLWPNGTSGPIEKVGFSSWCAFGTAAFFSSIAEAAVMWIIPGIYIVIALCLRFYRWTWPTTAWLLPGGFSVIALLVLISVGASSPRETPLRISPDRTLAGQGQPKVWAIAATESIGSLYGRVLRRELNSLREVPIGVTSSWDALPSTGYDKLVVFAPINARYKSKIQSLKEKGVRLVLVNPRETPEQLGITENFWVRVVFGDFSQSPAIYAWDSMRGAPADRVPGMGDFVGNWVEILRKYSP
jgi:hypothetical protein